MNALKLIELASSKLKHHSIPSYKLDTEILLSKILKKKREEILINLNQLVSPNQIIKFHELVQRRSLGEPVAYLVKEKEFWSKMFDVNRSTLIPRPETELMVERLVKIYNKKRLFILDIGTGSGCILISLLAELKSSKGIGIDISKKAIKIAKKNAIKHRMIKNINLLERSFTDLHNYKFDLIVSNPPYIQRKEINKLDDDIKKYEPKIALDGGNDGLDVIRKVIYKAKEILKFNGMLAIEIGNEQYNLVSKILNKNNFRVEHIIKDYKENIRSLISRYCR
tara:strand:+ start:257 stop:1099 length:843 start_codon:yes stop_codon:yes gene_type:complete